MNGYEFQLEDTIVKIKSVLSAFNLDKIRIAYSGGSDSDIVIHLIKKSGFDVISVFYDTGIEWQATKDHVIELLPTYNVDTIKADRPVPISNKVYGHPFLNKRVSDYLERLQKHNFNFQEHGNLSFEELWKLYPKCKASLRWWTNNFGYKSRFNIEYNTYLKEFLIEYGLPFKVSGKCCDGAKKMPMKKYIKANDTELLILGLRKSEGGARVGAYGNSCFSEKTSYGYAMYRPIWFWNDAMKEWYINEFKIKLSDCYTKYGLKRTGCAGCPFGLTFDNELELLEKNEPKLAKGINNIFAPSYEWTRKYREFQREMKKS